MVAKNENQLINEMFHNGMEIRPSIPIHDLFSFQFVAEGGTLFDQDMSSLLLLLLMMVFQLRREFFTWGG